ncbi:MAG: hypothetical protein QOK19_1918 [Solirubrobacteraceae bacterium]|jgi:hypothetical protein|nr:hypothetical protein [Solirubrobacterales bacterium]MEA2216357.1 hypothetical protein [Solirubrobacteraceae bacterium]
MQTHEGSYMFNRGKTLTALLATAAVTALAVGGVASATKGKTVHKKAAHHAVKHSSRASETPTGPDTDNVQAGDQTTPDSIKASSNSASQSASSETGSETGSSESAASDGPGGHEDPAGAEEDHQFEGVE